MPQAVVIRPDVRFIENLIASGGTDLKKCFQCATCTSVCSLSGDTLAFPRQQMIKAQWGLKESLLGDPGIWLCHNCGDCTAKCPRGAKPGEVMGAIRAESIKHYAVPRFAGLAASKPAFLAMLLAIPFGVLSSVALEELRHGLVRPYVYAELFPQHIVDAIFGSIALFVCLCFAWGAARLIKDIRSGGLDGSILTGLRGSIAEIVTHTRFSKCSAERNRYWGHLFTLAGFVALTIVTTAEAAGINLGTVRTPLPLLDPWKLLANAGAVVIFTGLAIVLWDRIHDRKMRTATTYFDWFFLLTLMGAVVTGILSEVLRLAQIASLMYPFYLLHLVLVFSLFLYAPYSKFAHVVYRTVAMAAVWENGRQQPLAAVSDRRDVGARRAPLQS